MDWSISERPPLFCSATNAHIRKGIKVERNSRSFPNETFPKHRHFVVIVSNIHISDLAVEQIS